MTELRRFRGTWPDGRTATATLYMDGDLSDDRYGDSICGVDTRWSDDEIAKHVLETAPGGFWNNVCKVEREP